MCGIAGLLGPFTQDRLRAGAVALADAQRHRGPDGAGVHAHGPVAIAHRRLSIIDLESGAQPLSNEDGSVWISFNGEIYNYRELRSTLLSRGHVFRTQSDTEVIVHAYEEWGDDCVRRLRGMFAFAINDTRRNRLFLARDQFGIKPLVYMEQDGWFAFASELQAFHSLADTKLELDVRAIDEYLALQYIPAPRTIYKQARKLPPAHVMSVDYDGRVHAPTRYWRPEFNSDVTRTDKQWLEAFDAAITDSVRAHLVSDVPVGAFLSGGLDSTGVVAIAQKLSSQPIRTFSIGFADPAHDESAWAAQAAAKLGTQHHCEVVDVNALEALPQLVSKYGEPFGDSSAVATMAVARIAAEQVKTVLTGDGGDEGMAGYHSHLAWLQWVSQSGEPHISRPSVGNWQQFIQYCDPTTRQRLWAGEQRGRTLLPIESFEQAWTEARELGVVQRVQYMDALTYLPNDILTKVDIASMAHSLETRTPLIDVELWSLLTQMPERVNIGVDPNGALTGKHILKKLLSRWFPDPFLHRKKQGFAVPLARWLAPNGEARRHVEARLLGTGSALRSLFDTAPARELLASGRHGPVWVLLVLEEWLRQEAARAGMPTVSLGADPIDVFPPPPNPATTRPRILVIADVPNWIFERHARQLQQLLADDFDITVQYHTEAYNEHEWDLIYPLEYGLVPTDRIQCPWKYVTGVRSHVSWTQFTPENLGNYLALHFQQTHVVSERLRRELLPVLPNVAYVTHGIDAALFRPIAREPLAGRKLRVGWAGNSKTSVKGFDEFIKPLGQLPGVELRCCGYSDRNLSLEAMAAWYRDIDVYVCASLSEGSNNSILEAAATACAIVTTDNGTVPEFLRNGVEAFIVPRDGNAFAAAITILADDDKLRIRMGLAAAASVLPDWTWAKKKEEYRRFFSDALGSRVLARRRMATTTPAGQRWMTGMIERVQRSMTRGQSEMALAAINELIDVDATNEGFQQVRNAIIAEVANAVAA
ncbi:MAG: asparagine synthase (glutamine-hydrolyzing) [Gemmatimonadota bacterium]|nr:asparagine synthase (glutamine-hydrolyzing) [Gemmatimonadota bacterium]